MKEEIRRALESLRKDGLVEYCLDDDAYKISELGLLSINKLKEIAEKEKK